LVHVFDEPKGVSAREVNLRELTHREQFWDEHRSVPFISRLKTLVCGTSLHAARSEIRDQGDFVVPIIRVEMFKGRNREQKRALVRELTEGFLRTCGGKAEQVHIVIADIDPEDWGSAGELVADRLEAKKS
jgi:4-oxalocrotonate tautomerase